jgi:hypothetical protein
MFNNGEKNFYKMDYFLFIIIKKFKILMVNIKNEERVEDDYQKCKKKQYSRIN